MLRPGLLRPGLTCSETPAQLRASRGTSRPQAEAAMSVSQEPGPQNSAECYNPPRKKHGF